MMLGRWQRYEEGLGGLARCSIGAVFFLGQKKKQKNRNKNKERRDLTQNNNPLKYRLLRHRSECTMQLQEANDPGSWSMHWG
jgi:hypothetical protein